MVNLYLCNFSTIFAFFFCQGNKRQPEIEKFEKQQQKLSIGLKYKIWYCSPRIFLSAVFPFYDFNLYGENESIDWKISEIVHKF